MTPRMTVGVTVLAIGLAVAALAGIPGLVENRAVGDIIMLCGLFIAIVGLVLVFSAVRGQWSATAQLKRSQAIDIKQLQLELRSLRIQRTALTGRIKSAKAKPREPDNMRLLTALAVELNGIEIALTRNANEFERLEVEPSEAPYSG